MIQRKPRYAISTLTMLVSATVASWSADVHAQPQDAPPPASDTATTPPPVTTPETTTPPPPPSAPIDAPAPPPVRPLRFTGTLGAISLPRLLALELLARFRKKEDPRWDLFAVGAGIDYLPPGVANFGEDTTLSWLQFGADARFFVWRFLFAGVRLGWQFSRADSEKFGSEVDYVTTAFVIAPKIGALYTFERSGFTIGGDLGATIPVAPETTLYSDSTQDSNARKASKTFGMFVMPQVALRVGWTF